jgi:hypothetical protein
MRTQRNDPNSLDFGSRLVQSFYKRLQWLPMVPFSGPYHLTISDAKKFVWFRVAKVATRTIVNHFKQQQVPLSAEHPSGVFYSPRLYRDYFKFAFVRNPWDRLVSCWTNRVREINYFKFTEAQLETMSRFENFVTYVEGLDIANCNRHLQLQCRLMDLREVNFIGRLESFAEGFRIVCNQLGVECASIESRNVSGERKPYQEYYTPELQERVSKIYQRDIQIFGYEF